MLVTHWAGGRVLLLMHVFNNFENFFKKSKEILDKLFFVLTDLQHL